MTYKPQPKSNSVSGFLYGPSGPFSSDLNPIQNTLYLCPFDPTGDLVVDGIAVKLTALFSAADVVMGLYLLNKVDPVLKLLEEAALHTFTSTVMFVSDIPDGDMAFGHIYVLGVVMQSAGNIRIQGLNNVVANEMGGPMSQNPPVAPHVDGVSGALPPTINKSAIIWAGQPVPLMYVRAK